MALIPPDVGVQLRAQLESQLQPLGPVRPIPADLPELQIGQAFTARIQEALPENTYRAMVAGKQLTLQLPEGAKPGDMLELVVIDRSARAVIARMAPQPTAEGAQAAYPFARLSPAGQMIGRLLVPEGETPTPAPLNRSQPLLSQPPASAQDLLPALKSAVTQSGLFYESHQAQWVTGRFPLASLLHEPQGRHSAPDLLTAHRIEPEQSSFRQAEIAPTPPRPMGVTALLAGLTGGEEAAAQMPAAGSGVAPAPTFSASSPKEPQGSHSAPELMSTQRISPEEASFRYTEVANSAPRATETTALHAGLTGGEEAAAQMPAAGSGVAPAPTFSQVPSVPEELRPLVQQQLEAAAGQRLMWHGEVWPGQNMEWQIEWERPEGEGGNAAAEDGTGAERWRTTLSLTTPRLGRIDATLQLEPAGVRIALATPQGASVVDLRDDLPALAAALGEAGVPLLAMQVKHESG